jgi:enolase-phosphatase E1
MDNLEDKFRELMANSYGMPPGPAVVAVIEEAVRILLDIEGTTTPITFVYDVLFPFAREHAQEHLDHETQQALKLEYETDIAKGLTPPPWTSGAVHYVYWLMDQDRKSTALKNLQGKIWQEGYRRGDLQGAVFPDVPPALERWHKAGIDLRIYSSGSILAQ